MIQPITIKNVTIGEGMPKIIVPIVAATREGVLEKAAEIAPLKIHMVEWRADFYGDIEDTKKTLSTLKALRGILKDKILLFTFRSANEGGNRAIDREAYKALNLSVAKSGDSDVVDVEVFTLGKEAKAHIASLQAAGVRVIGSNHDFSKTPAEADIIERLKLMQQAGADIPKIAVMPRCKEDVLTLLSATEQMSAQYADRPIITMSMAPMGVLSRLSGEVFGSAMTFGAVGSVSAPGQIPVEQLEKALTILHNAI